MSNHDDFWTTLATGHTNTVLAGSMDTHLSGKSIDETFGSVRTLTDRHREANALALPVEAGTKVVFAGGLGAVMSYDNAPADGITGEVVTVKSATGEITHHDGKVFVKWADGKFRPIHAEHLRLAGSRRTAMEHASPEALKQYLKDHPDADKSKHTVSKGKGEGSGGEKDEKAKSSAIDPDDLWDHPAKKVRVLTMTDRDIEKQFSEKNTLSPKSIRKVLTKVTGDGVTLEEAFDAVDAAIEKHDGRGKGEAGAFHNQTAKFLKELRKAIEKDVGAEYRDFDFKPLGKTAGRGAGKTHPVRWSSDDLDAMNLVGYFMTGSTAETALRWMSSGEAVPEEYNDEILAAIKRMISVSMHAEAAKRVKGLEKTLRANPGVLVDRRTGEPIGRHASDIKAQFEKIKALAEKRPDSDFLKSILKQMADKGFAPTDKQMAVVKKIEGEVKQQGEMKKELKGLDKKGEFNADDIGKKQNGPLTRDPEDKKIMDHFGQGDLHELSDVAQDKTATFRVASLGDLTDFLKVASGALVHKSTKDLWSYSKDADGNFLVSRLFDDEGEPLKV